MNFDGTVAVSPRFVNGTGAYTVGTQFDVSIKLVNASAMNVFTISVMTRRTILDPIRITQGNVFPQNDPSVFVKNNCVDNTGPSGGCLPQVLGIEGPGVATFGMVWFGQETANQTTSTLFTITYNVTGIGATDIHILPASVSGANNHLLVVTRQHGIFSNKACGVTICTTPRTSFSIPANSTLVGDRPVFFNASRSVALNIGASIINYDWTFGDGNGIITILNSTTHTYTYPHVGVLTVILRVTDNTDSFGIFSYAAQISRFFIDLAIGPADMTIDQNTYVTPGAQIHIGLTVTNLSTKIENETVSIRLPLSTGNLTLGSKQFLNVNLHTKTRLNATWDTSNYVPRVYRVIGHVDPVLNGTLLVENVTSNNEVIGFVQLVDPSPAGLSLGLVSGISFVGLLVVAAGSTFLRRLFSRKPELDAELLK